MLGPNGAGKSTTMRMIACRSPLTSGELLVEGLDVRTQGRQIRSLIGVVPQDNNLDPDLNVIKNLIIYASYYGIPKKQATERADDRRFAVLVHDDAQAVVEIKLVERNLRILGERYRRPSSGETRDCKQAFHRKVRARWFELGEYKR